MPGDSTSKKGGKTIQTTLTKTKDTDITKEKPPKQKRTHSDVAEESVSDVGDLSSIHTDLEEIKTSLNDSLKKKDLEEALSDVVKKTDLEAIVTTAVCELFEKFKQEFEDKLREKTNDLQNQIDALSMDNEQLRENIRDKDRKLHDMKQDIADNLHRATEALKLANYNEQYSRKNNIRILHYVENEDEDLKTKFISKVKNDCDVDILPNEIVAIHRIPGKINEQRPVIVKLLSMDVKTKIMKKRKDIGDGVRFFDDITKRNMGLMKRLKEHEEVESAWYFNGSIYAKTFNGRRGKYDIFDNIDSKIKGQSKGKPLNS